MRTGWRVILACGVLGSAGLVLGTPIAEGASSTRTCEYLSNAQATALLGTKPLLLTTRTGCVFSESVLNQPNATGAKPFISVSVSRNPKSIQTVRVLLKPGGPAASGGQTKRSFIKVGGVHAVSIVSNTQSTGTDGSSQANVSAIRDGSVVQVIVNGHADAVTLAEATMAEVFKRM